MPVINRTLTLTLTQSLPSSSNIVIFSIPRHHFTTSVHLSRDSHYHRSEFQSQGAGFTSAYDPDQPTRGPLAQASNHGAPRLTPTLLKAHLDKFVVGQDKPKKVVSVAIFNHYQRIREQQRQEAEEYARREQQSRWELRERERRAHPVENEFPGHVESVDLNALTSQREPPSEPELGSLPLSETINPNTIIEKSNLLLLGPSGVGKTYILQTLASVLEVPFATIDCSSLTQAGYIGSDIESAVERLLLAADYNTSRCETGIIFFDEVDKLAKPAIMTHGRDVSGEGVQQGLLKMIEGTTVTVNAKSDRSSKTDGRGNNDRIERGRETSSSSQSGPGGKSEQYTIDTRNILFVFAGAFVGLEKIISSRLSAGTSIGFGARLRNPPSSLSTSSQSSNPLSNLTPTDLQTYGLIPELIGRIPILTTLEPLTLPHLVQILTEPKNSLVRQYTALLQTSNIKLRFTTGALWAIAEKALHGSLKRSSTSSPSLTSTGKNTTTSKPQPEETETETENPPNPNATGARSLRSILESVLFNLMFKGPGSAIRYSLIDEKFVRELEAFSSPSSHSSTSSSPNSSNNTNARTTTSESSLPRCWSRGQEKAWEDAWENEEERWRRRRSGDVWKSGSGDGDGDGDDGAMVDFQAFRRVGGSGM